MGPAGRGKRFLGTFFFPGYLTAVLGKPPEECLGGLRGLGLCVGAGAAEPCAVHGRQSRARMQRWLVLVIPCILQHFQSWNHSAWKSPQSPWSPTIPPALPRPPLIHVPKGHIHPAVESPRRDGDSWAAEPGLDNPSSEEISPKIQPKPLQRMFPLVLLLLTWQKSPTPTWLLSGRCGE